MKKVLMVLGVVFVVALVAVVATCFAAKAKLEPIAEAILRDLQAGQHEKVYAEAAPAFRASVTPEAFRATVRAIQDLARLADPALAPGVADHAQTLRRAAEKAVGGLK